VVLSDHFCSLRRTIKQEPRACPTIRRCCSASTVSVVRVERLDDGTRRVHLATADDGARACPACGVISVKPRGTAVTRPRDPPHGELGLEFRWHKRRWHCREPACPRRSFTKQIRQIPARARLTARLREAAGRRVRDAGSTVIQAARDLRLSWPTVMDAFRGEAFEVTSAPLPPVEVPGIDETGRGRTQWRQNPETGSWEPVADQWHTGFVDAGGSGGLLGQVKGRTPSDVLAWLASTPLEWRRAIRYVAIEMSTGYRAAVRTGLPHTTIVVDHFHVSSSRTRSCPPCAAAPPPVGVQANVHRLVRMKVHRFECGDGIGP
jgi:transposase